jgi:hypothetical protein
MTAFSPFADRSSGYLTRAIDVAFGLVIVIKCKMMLQPIGLLALCPTIACYSWTLVTALPIHGISILAMTLKPYILPRQSAGFQLWSFGMGDEESNAGTASPPLNDWGEYPRFLKVARCPLSTFYGHCRPKAAISGSLVVSRIRE